MWFISSLIVVLLSTLGNIAIRGVDIDLNVCDPLNLTAVAPPPPALPLSFSTSLEWKWVDTNETISVTEFHDGIFNIGSQTITMLGHQIHIIYDYQEDEYLVYNQDTGFCNATLMGTLVFYNNKVWLTATKMIYQIAREGNAPYMGRTVVRSLAVNHWKACLFIFQSAITLEVDMYFSVSGWGMALSDPSQMVPVRFEMKGSHNYNVSGANVTYFHVIGDFIDFNPKPTFQQTMLQLPPGTYCDGRKSRKPMNLLPNSFSLVREHIDIDNSQITYEIIHFHTDKRLISRYFKDASGRDHDPMIYLYDFNVGIHYNIDSYTLSCTNALIRIGDLYTKPYGNDSITMQSALDFFNVDKAQTQYVGTRTTRGVVCDVWVGRQLDVFSARNDYIEWYFAKDNWVTAVELVIETAALVRIDIWKGKGRLVKPIVYNIYRLDSVTPQLDVFNVAPCYKPAQKRRILIPFKAINGGLDKVSASYLKERLHDELTTKSFIHPLRLADILLDFQGDSMVYFAATLLDRPPYVNNKLYPKPQGIHDLEETYSFLNGIVNGPFQLSLNTTIGTKGVVIQATGLFDIDYKNDASTSTSTTMRSTTEATPPPPTLASTTAKQDIPTPGTKPTIRSTTPTTTPTTPITTSTTPTTTSTTPTSTVTPTTTVQVTVPASTPTTASSTSTILTTLQHKTTASRPTSTQRQCNCPSISCTKVTQMVTAKPISCVPQTPVTPCPTVKKDITSQSTTDSSGGSTKDPLAQHQDPNGGNSSGISGGVVAAIAVVMLVAGLFFGVLAVRVFQIYRKARGSESHNILSKYLDNDLKY